jgi:hypothetical protein
MISSPATYRGVAASLVPVPDETVASDGSAAADAEVSTPARYGTVPKVAEQIARNARGFPIISSRGFLVIMVYSLHSGPALLKSAGVLPFG